MDEEKPKKKRKKAAAEGEGGERGYIVVPYSAEEIEARKRMLAYDARPENESGNDAIDANDEFF